MSRAARAPRTLLVALNTDPGSWRADGRLIEGAVALARRLDAELVLLHVGYQPELGEGCALDREELDSRRLRYLAAHRTRQQQLATRIEARTGLRVYVSTRWDDDRCRAILRTKDRRASLLILKSLEVHEGGGNLPEEDAELLRTAGIGVWVIADDTRAAA